MRVIVTGATSFIGAETVRLLLQKGEEVLAVVRPGSRNLSHLKELTEGLAGLAVRELDLRDIGTLSSPADAFLHLAWDGAGSGNRTLKDIQAENAELSLGAVRAAAACGCKRFLFTGSQAEYGIRHERITEETPTDPVSEYGKAKVKFGKEAAALCRDLSMDYIHTRIFSIYGPGDHPWTLVNSCIDTWKKGQCMELSDCTQEWNFLYVTDVAAALWHLLREGPAGTYNVASADTRPLRSYIEELYELCGRKGSYRYGLRPQNAEGAADLMPSIEKILGETTWKPETSFRDGILGMGGANER